MRRLALGGVAVSTVLVAAAYALAFLPGPAERLAPALLACGTAGMLGSVMALGAQRRGRLGLLWIPVGCVLLVVGGGMVALVLMPAVDAGDPSLLLGLPPRAALLLYGVGLLPTLVVPVAYALTFERLTLSSEDLERVRRAARHTGAGPDADPNGGAHG